MKLHISVTFASQAGKTREGSEERREEEMRNELGRQRVVLQVIWYFYALICGVYSRFPTLSALSTLTSCLHKQPGNAARDNA